MVRLIKQQIRIKKLGESNLQWQSRHYVDKGRIVFLLKLFKLSIKSNTVNENIRNPMLKYGEILFCDRCEQLKK